MKSNTKQKQQHIDRELMLGTGAVVLLFPILLTAITFSLVGVISGFILLVGSGTVVTSLTMIIVYGLSLAIFALAIRFFVRRFQTLVTLRQAIQDEHNRLLVFLDTTSAERRLANPDIKPSSKFLTDYETKAQRKSNDQ